VPRASACRRGSASSRWRTMIAATARAADTQAGSKLPRQTNACVPSRSPRTTTMASPPLAVRRLPRKPASTSTTRLGSLARGPPVQPAPSARARQWRTGWRPTGTGPSCWTRCFRRPTGPAAGARAARAGPR
jgi:hypothetical protein